MSQVLLKHHISCPRAGETSIAIQKSLENARFVAILRFRLIAMAMVNRAEQVTKSSPVEPLDTHPQVADERQVMEVALAVQALIIYALVQYVISK